MARGSTRPFLSRGGFVRAFARAVGVLTLLAVVYVGLAKLDLVWSPLDPSLHGDVAAAESGREGLRVLFVGNSFTYENSMPSLVESLAAGDRGARPVFAAWYTAPGWRLEKASEEGGTIDVLRRADWDAVVLQEQSRIPSFAPYDVSRLMYPYARDLVVKIRARGARPLLFMTWAYEHGDTIDDVPGDTYDSMQARLRDGYETEGRELGVPVVPVGLAWAAALRARPELELWARDGEHPSRLGSYLAACVFYAVLTGRDPRASDFTDGLPLTTVRFLQRVASTTVAGTA